MTPEAANLYGLIRSVRTCFNRLKGLADDMHRDLGVNASMRAVMEATADDGDRTVPDIARAKGVSRQHIQVNADALIKAGLAEQRPNPAHKRSPLLRLTPQGRRAFDVIREREKAVLEDLAAAMPSDRIGPARETLDALNRALIERETSIGDAT